MKTKEIIEVSSRELGKEVTARPLEHKGFNRHFLNLINADVFKPQRKGFWGIIKNFFSA